MRIGHGYDVHRFGEGDFITLGGVRIPHKFGLVVVPEGDPHGQADEIPAEQSFQYVHLVRARARALKASRPAPSRHTS